MRSHAVPPPSRGSTSIPAGGPGGRTSLYFDELGGRIADAGRRIGFIERHYRIGGRVVRLRFAGPALVAPLTRALAHLAAPPVVEPALTVDLADGSAVELPPPPWELLGTRPPVSADRETRPAMHVRDERVQGLVELGHGTLSLFDTPSCAGLFWTASAARLVYYERGAPLRAILYWWGLRHGWHMAHAGAVGADEGGVLLVGKGGSGKSTAALACLGAGLAYVGDNDVLLEGGPTPFVHGLYCSAKLEAGHLRRALPHLGPLLETAEPWERGKGLFFLDEGSGQRLSAGFPLRAVLLPRVTTAERATTRRVSSAAGLLALAPSTLFQLPGARQERLRRLAGVLERVPTYVLELGTDLGTVAPAIQGVLAAGADGDA